MKSKDGRNGEEDLKEMGGLINFPPLKRRGVIREGGAYLRGGA